MLYLSQILGNPIEDAEGKHVGTVQDLGIATEEVFPTVTVLLYKTDSDESHLIVCKDSVASVDKDKVILSCKADELTFSELRNSEVLLVRDLLDKEIVDMRSMKVVHVDNIKLAASSTGILRLNGAVVREPGVNFDKIKRGFGFGKEEDEELVAWNYIDFLHRNLDRLELMKTHKLMDDLHPADIADIIEQVDEDDRAAVLNLLNEACVAEAIAELDEDDAADILDDMDETKASRVLSEMDPDDAAELVDELEDEKAKKLLHLMGLKEQQAVRKLLEYKDETAGRIMTDEFVSISENSTVQEAIELIRGLDEDFETINYVYLVDDRNHLTGTISLRSLIVNSGDTQLKSIANMQVIFASPEEDQEDVALSMSKYNLLALPIVDESHHILGIVTADDALNIMEEEHEEDLQIAGAGNPEEKRNILTDILTSEVWLAFWAVGTLLTVALFGAHTSLVYILFACMGLPIALHSTSTAIRNATSYYFENDPGDEDALPFSTFMINSIGSFMAFALILVAARILLVLLGSAFLMAVPSNFAMVGIYASFITSAIVIGLIVSAVSYFATPLWLRILRSRDEQNLTTSGFVLRLIGYTGAVVLFLLIFMLVTFVPFI